MWWTTPISAPFFGGDFSQWNRQAGPQPNPTTSQPQTQNQVYVMDNPNFRPFFWGWFFAVKQAGRSTTQPNNLTTPNPESGLCHGQPQFPPLFLGVIFRSETGRQVHNPTQQPHNPKPRIRFMSWTTQISGPFLGGDFSQWNRQAGPQPNPTTSQPQTQNQVYVMDSSKMTITQPYGATPESVTIGVDGGPITPTAPRAMESLTTVYTLVTKAQVTKPKRNREKGWKRFMILIYVYNMYIYIYYIYADVITLDVFMYIVFYILYYIYTVHVTYN